MSVAEITLSTIGSRNVRLCVVGDGDAGKVVIVHLADQSMVLTLTQDEARWLAEQLLDTGRL